MKIKRIDLRLFDTAGDGGATNGVDSGAPSQNNGSTDLSNVVYGKSPEPATQDVEKEFDELIKGKYKEQYGKRVQSTVESRVKGLKDVEAKYKALDPVLEMLGTKYGADKNDPASIMKALEEDDSFYEDEAFDKGLTVEQLKVVKKLERENKELKAKKEEQAEKERIDANLAKWIQQAEVAKATYPNLDLGEELKNPQFVAVLECGLDVPTAYFAVHNQELVPKAIEYTAKQTEAKITNKIRANGARPTENGLSNSATSIYKNDVSKFTKEDRREIARRVARGEHIVL